MSEEVIKTENLRQLLSPSLNHFFTLPLGSISIIPTQALPRPEAGATVQMLVVNDWSSARRLSAMYFGESRRNVLWTKSEDKKHARFGRQTHAGSGRRKNGRYRRSYLTSEQANVNLSPRQSSGKPKGETPSSGQGVGPNAGQKPAPFV